MKRALAVFFIVCVAESLAFPWTKEEAEKTIEQAKSMLYEIDNNEQLAPFYPYKEYSSAVTNIIIAGRYIEKKDFKTAFFYSKLSMIELQTVDLIARAREFNQKKILLENQYYKKSNRFSVLADAGLIKKGPAYKTDLSDRDLFSTNILALSPRGKESMTKILEVLKVFPSSRVKVVGHTSFHDKNNLSKTKADAVLKFLVKSGIEASRAESEGMGNREVVNTPLGFMRADRVEIIISGIGI